MKPDIYGNEPTAEPDLIGVAGRAWEIPAPADPRHTTIGAWLVHYPSAHPFWWWYTVAIIHLRPQEGADPPNLQFPGATHELMFLALNPERPLPDLGDWKEMSWLEPIDLVHQVILPGDDEAKELGVKVVRYMLEFAVSPDSDNRAYWQRTLDNTAEHIRLGGHPT